MKIVFTIVPETVAGGVYVTEMAFLDQLQKQADLSVYPVRYGRRRDDESLLTKAIERIVDLWNFNNLLRSVRPDVVHLNSALDRKALIRDVPFILLISQYQCRLFLKWHGTDISLVQSWSWVWRCMISYVIQKSNHIGVLSTEERTNLSRAGYSTEKIAVVKNCLADRNYPSVQSRRDKVGVDLLFVGRMMLTKGVFDVLEATRLLTLSGVKLRLTCVGSGHDLDEARTYVKVHNLQACVQFIGQVTEEVAWGYYSNSDILVFPTYHQEGFPMTILHSMAAGLAIVTTRIRASADYLSDPENCRWVNPRDPSDLEGKIRDLIDKREVREAMGVRNQQLARQFLPKIVVDEVRQLYE
jgi:glycosyltransferase involved in cell wall biosynthesis